MSRKIVGAVLSGLVAATLCAVPAVGEESETSAAAESLPAPKDSDADGVLDASSTAAALAGAAEKDRPVEDLSQRTETFSTIANPDGTFTGTDHAVAVRVLQGSEWVDVDSTLEKQANGTYVPKAATSDVTVGGGGTKEAARVTFKDGKSLALTWPTVLPTPSVKGSVATYSLSEASDLVVTVTGAGVAAHLRLNSRPAENDPVFTFGLRTVDLDVSETSGGGLKMTDEANTKVGSTANLVAWDSRTDAAGDPAKIVPLAADLTDPVEGRSANTQTLKLTAPDGYLSDPKTLYPVIIDPDINAANLIRDTYTRAGDTVPAGTQSKLIVGRLGDSSNTSPARTLIQWENTFLAGKTVTAASMNFYQYFGGSCSAKDVNIHPLVGEFYESTTVDTNRPAVDTGTGTSSILTASKGPSCSGGAGYVSASVVNMAKAWAKGPSAGGFANWGVQLNVPSASSSDGSFERRFCAEELSTITGDPCATAGRAPYMQFTYSDAAPTAPATPTVSYDANDVRVAAVVTATTSNGNVRAKFLVKKGTVTVFDGYSASVPSGSSASVVLPQPSNGTYTAQAWANDGGQSSTSSSATRTFQVDSSSPPAPTVTCTGGYADKQWYPSRAGTSINCTATSTGAYDIQSRQGQDTAPVTTSGSSATRTFSVPEDGVVALTFTARSASGVSDATSYSFGIGPGGAYTADPATTGLVNASGSDVLAPNETRIFSVGSTVPTQLPSGHEVTSTILQVSTNATSAGSLTVKNKDLPDGNALRVDLSGAGNDAVGAIDLGEGKLSITNTSNGPVSVWISSLGWYSLDPAQLINATSTDSEATDGTDATSGDTVYTLDEDGNRIYYNDETDGGVPAGSPLARSSGDGWWDGQCGSNTSTANKYDVLKVYQRNRAHSRQKTSNSKMYCGKDSASDGEAAFGLRHIRAGHKSQFALLAAYQARNWGNFMHWSVGRTLQGPLKRTVQSSTRYCYLDKFTFELGGAETITRYVVVILGKTGERIITAFPTKNVNYCQGQAF